MNPQPNASDLARDLEGGVSLPASWFTDPAVVEREYERIFHRTWQYFCRAEQLAKVGDFVAGAAGRVPVVVVRNEHGLSGFVNVCRHRRHVVMSGCGNRKALQCPYHAWTYDLEGRLKAAPRCENDGGFQKEDFPLVPVRVDTWGPFVFVNVNVDTRPLAHYLGELPQIIAQCGLDLMHLKLRKRREWRANANWKVMIENYLECYHCPVAHPGFSAVINVDPDAYVLKPFEWFSSQYAPVRASALEGKGKKPAYDVRGAVTQSQYHFLWPNLTFNINPGHPNLSIDLWLPDGPDFTRGFSEQFFGPDVPDEWAEQMSAFNKEVGDEDDALTNAVQAGMRAGIPVRGRFLRNAEKLPLHFEKLIIDALLL
jgi:phenylpropionate dioxygenase-like ring-hydroxylating dioxygenase large terminal subunit